MFGCLGQSHDAEVIARAVTVPALGALAVIHVVDLPNTLGPTPLVGIGYFGIIVAAVLAAGAMIVRSQWLVWGARQTRDRVTRASQPRRPLRTVPEYSPRS
jgi:hypothetical protein